MRVRKIVQKPVNLDRDGIRIVGGLNLVISANDGEGGNTTSASSQQDTRIVQGGAKSRTYTGDDPHKEVEHD